MLETINNEVKEQKQRVDAFVQTVMKLRRLPVAIRELETRMRALEDAEE